MMKWITTTAYVLALGILVTGCVAESPKKRDHDRIVITDDDETWGADEEAVVELTNSDDELIIELTWNTPGDVDQTDKDGADIDLHFRHPDGRWNQEPYDIFWGNPTADWGDEGAEDDPVLEVDDSDGKGPERVVYRGMMPEVGFDVGVHYYTDNGFGPSYPTVRIFRAGEVVFQRDTRLEDGEFWLVGQVTTDDVHVIDVVDGQMPPG